MSWSRPFIERPVATTLLTLGVALAGLAAAWRLPVAPLPAVDFPTISVQASLPGASPETMAATVATPLERALGSIAGVDEITSSSALGSTRITLQFDLGRDIDGAARDVQAALNAARTLLPSGLPGSPTWRKVNPADAPVMILALRSDTLTRGQMYDAASTVLAQRLSAVPGVGQVTVGGGALPAVRVDVDPERLAARGLSLENVRAAIVGANAQRPLGQLEDGARHWQLGANDQARSAAEYAPLLLSYRNGAAVRLRDVAQLSDSVQDLRNDGLADGQSAVLLILNKAPGANILDTVARVRALLPQLQAAVPAAVQISVVMDRTASIRASVAEVGRTLAIACGLVLLVVLLFLRRLRAALVPAVAVPVSLAGTCALMFLLGYSLDNLSLMALTVATGFVVDDAIVVLENVARHVEHGLTPHAAALRGAREIGFTVVAISLSLVAVFIPLLAMGGIVGRLFREFSVVLSMAILVSMLVSLSTTPMMAARLLQPPAPAPATAPAGPRGAWAALGRRIAGGLAGAERRLVRAYRRSLRWALRHRPLVLLVLVAVVACNGLLYAQIPKGFFPQQDVGLLVGGVRADQASSFQAMQGKLRELAHTVGSDPAVAHATAYTGGGQRNTASLFISLKPRDEREGVDAVMARLRARLARLPGASVFLAPVQDIRVGGRQANAAWQYTLQGDDLGTLNTWAPRIRRALAALPELSDVDSDQQDRGLQTTLLFDRDALARAGLSMAAVDATLNDAFGQRQVGVIYNPLNQYRVVLGYGPAWLQGPQTLQTLHFTAPGGAQVPLAQVARVQSTQAAMAVNHQGGAPATTIAFNLAEGVSLSQATAAVAQACAQLGVPVSVHGSFQGTARAFQDALRSQPWLIALAIASVYLVLGMLYESLLHPLTILSTLPSAGVGALLALQLFHTEFSVIALIGVVLLIGIVKKNAILMIDFAIAAQQAAAARGRVLGGSVAIYRAAARRLRPILMTTLAAVAGAVPLALGHGDGAELRVPLGLSIVGGLLLSQLLTLYTTPAVFAALEGLRRQRVPAAATPPLAPPEVHA